MKSKKHQVGSVEVEVPPCFTSCQCQCGSAEDPSSDPHHEEEHEQQHEHRLKVLFEVLDVNGDGGICIDDLTVGLKKLGVRRTQHEVMVGERLPGVDDDISLVSSGVACKPSVMFFCFFFFFFF